MTLNLSLISLSTWWCSLHINITVTFEELEHFRTPISVLLFWTVVIIGITTRVTDEFSVTEKGC